MIDWIKSISKNHPEFWTNYLKEFDSKTSPFIILYFTVDTKKQYLSIGGVPVNDNTIEVHSGFEIKLAPLHKEDFIKAIVQFLEKIKNAILVGYNIKGTIDFINKKLQELNAGPLKNETIELEIMFKKWKKINEEKSVSLKTIKQEIDIEISESDSDIVSLLDIAIIFLKLKNRLGIQ